MNDVLPESKNHCCKGTEMEHNLQKHARPSLHSEKFLDHTEVTEAAHRQKLQDTLDHCKQNHI